MRSLPCSDLAACMICADRGAVGRRSRRCGLPTPPSSSSHLLRDCASCYRILSVALANNYETAVSSSSLSPLVRDFTVAGDSWPSVQGRSRPWHSSAIVLDNPQSIFLRRDFQNINSTFSHVHLVHFRFYPPSLFLHATPMFLATFSTRGRRSTSIHH